MIHIIMYASPGLMLLGSESVWDRRKGKMKKEDAHSTTVVS